MELSKNLGNKYVLFGSRQDIMFPSRGADEAGLEKAFRAINIQYELGSDQSVYQNIVSSSAVVNIAETTNWLKEDTYNVVIDGFEYMPRLKINIVDPGQGLVPLSTGELNFIASKEENYWYLYTRDPRKVRLLNVGHVLLWSGYPQDIPRVGKNIFGAAPFYNGRASHDPEK